MYVQRYYLDCLSHASYLVADEETGEAAVIDPQRDIEIYLDDVRELGFKIKHVILTHFHADFIAGHIELRDRLGATIYLGRRAQAEFDFQPLSDGDTIPFSHGRLQAIETPGHTPEGISLLLFDDTKDGDNPQIIFTGDTLFIGDVGRPDLLASIGMSAVELAESLYDSLHHKILELPNETIVYPAHGAGSICGKQLGNEASSTIGEQRKYNYALQPMSQDEFVDLVANDLPPAPAYFGHDAMLNRQERASLESSMQDSLKPLNLQQLLELQEAGAQVVDVRSAIDFAGSHLQGAIHIDIDGRYATWAGTILDKDVPIVVIAEVDRVEETIMRLGRIGLDNVKGYLDKGMDALLQRPELLSITQRITAAALSDLENGETPLHIIDVRSPTEWEDGHINGSKNIPLGELSERLNEIPKTGTVIVHCQSGYRSSIAASLLANKGRDNVQDLVGGFKAWSVSRLPVETLS